MMLSNRELQTAIESTTSLMISVSPGTVRDTLEAHLCMLLRVQKDRCTQNDDKEKDNIPLGTVPKGDY